MCHFLKPRPRRLSSIPSKHPFSTPAHALPSPLLHLPRVILLPKGIWGRGSGPATCHSKASKQARLVETLLYFRCWQLEVGRAVDICPKADPHPPAGGDRSYRLGGVGGGLGCAKAAQSSLTVILKLIISGLTSVILFVSGTVNLQFQGPFVPISLWSVLRIVAAHVLSTVWSPCS